MVEIEYELTYLAKYIPKEISSLIPNTVTDYYLPESNCEHPNIRIRSKGNGKYEITKKEPLNGTDSSEQSEHTIIITDQEYKDLVAGRERSVTKDRYNIVLNGQPAEIDIFKDKLQGLVLIDFEFKNNIDKDNFVPPDICLADVTQDKFIAGGILAGKSYSDIKAKLHSFGYKKLIYSS